MNHRSLVTTLMTAATTLLLLLPHPLNASSSSSSSRAVRAGGTFLTTSLSTSSCFCCFSASKNAMMCARRKKMTTAAAHRHQGPPMKEGQVPYYPRPRDVDQSMLGDMSGGRPGAIIETEEQLEIKERMMRDLDGGERSLDAKERRMLSEHYGANMEDEEDVEYDNDDPDAIDASTWGTWTIQDLKSRFDYEWDPNDPTQIDPNMAELMSASEIDGIREDEDDGSSFFMPRNPVDEDGIEIGYNDPVFGPSNPIDTRTIVGESESYMIDSRTRDDDMVAKQFHDDDELERRFNDDVVKFRKSLQIIETYTDPFLSDDIPVPKRVAKWHGYPEQMYYEPREYTNNRFTKDEDRTNFDEMTPYRARRRAIELARSKNAEWLPDGVSQKHHEEKRRPYEEYGTLVGTLRKGDIDEELRRQIQPALRVLGSVVELLSIHKVYDNDDQENDEGGGVVVPASIVFRFHYHGLMKNRHGMSSWTEQMIRDDCGISYCEVSAVFETGFRKRDFLYDGGDPWYGPSN